MAKRKPRARKKAASQKLEPQRGSAGRKARPRRVLSQRKAQSVGSQPKKKPSSQRHGSRPVVRSVPLRQKKVAKRANRVRAKSIATRIRVPTHRRTLSKKVKRTPRLVRKPAPKLQRPPINASPDERTALKNALDVIRRHVKGYEGRNGYRLSDVVRFDKARQQRILQKSTTIKELLASPHDIVRPKNDQEKRALRPFARKQLRGAKHYIVHKPDDQSRVSLVRGRVRITRKRGRVEFDSIYFMFPHAPQGEDDAVEMLEEMLPEMPDGFYIMQTGAHGDTGEPVHKDRLIEQLRNYILAYEPSQAGVTWVEDESGEEKKVMHDGFTRAVMGYRFASTTLDGAVTERRGIDARRAAQKEYNAQLRKRNMTDVEKLEAKAEWARKRAGQRRKRAAKKTARARYARREATQKKRVVVRPVAKKKARSKK